MFAVGSSHRNLCIRNYYLVAFDYFDVADRNDVGLMDPDKLIRRELCLNVTHALQADYIFILFMNIDIVSPGLNVPNPVYIHFMGFGTALYKQDVFNRVIN